MGTCYNTGNLVPQRNSWLTRCLLAKHGSLIYTYHQMCHILGLRAVLVRKRSLSRKASFSSDKFSPLVDRRERWWRNDSSVSQNGVEFESIRMDIHDDYRNRWPSRSGTDVNSVKPGRTDCGRLTRPKSRFICCLRVVLSGLPTIICKKNWDIAKCVCARLVSRCLAE